ncbi:MAG: hypothetical protein U9Q30_07815 [Campylobacterota bacterium]|nr:hypothetical protein [Campylobacterota bacterium]
MFYKTTKEIIDKIDNLNQERKSIIELNLIEIKDNIQEAIFKLPKKENELDKNEKVNLGLLFLSYIYTIKDELSYNGLWLDIIDVLLENNENNFFINNFFIDENKPSIFLKEAIKEAIVSFDLRDGYDEDLSKTILLQIGLLSRFNNINLWLTSSSKQYIIEELTNRNHINFSNSFYNGWKSLQQYKDSILDKKTIYNILENNIWFQELNIDNLLESSKKELTLLNIAKDNIEDIFYLDKLLFKDEILEFHINLDEVFHLNLIDSEYLIYIDDKFIANLIKEKNRYKIDKDIIISNPTNLIINISIKDKYASTIYFQEFTIFDFNQDTIIFDNDGKWTDDKNTKLDKKKVYNILIDSDFDIYGDNLKEYEYFDGYANLITNITDKSNFSADDGDSYKFNLNFNKIIKKPLILNELELFTQSEFLSFDEKIKYQLKRVKLSKSVRVNDTLINIDEDIEILRWAYSGGVIYDIENNDNFNYDIDLSYEILTNRKNTLQIKIGENTFTKVLNLSIIEDSKNPNYRIFSKDKDNNIEFITKDKKLDQNILNKNIIVTSFHKIFLTKPKLNKQYIRDKADIFGTFILNRAFKIDKYPFFGEEISTSLNIYDDTRWNSIGKISRYKKLNYIKDDNIQIITLDKNYQLNIQENLIIDEDILGYCVVKDNKYYSSYFKDNNLDINIIFQDKEILKFLRFSYFEFGEYFNEAKFDINRAFREKARNDKKKVKRVLRENILKEPFIFLDAFLADKFNVGELSLDFNFDESKRIIEQILFTIEFDEDSSLKIIQYSILNQLQDKMIKIPIFLVYLLNIIKNKRYIDIFFDEINLDIDNNSIKNSFDEEFYNRMISALLGDHKIDRYEKINIKTISQTDIKDNLIKDSLVLIHK